MKYVGIDPGSKAGWAVLDGTGYRVGSGTWDCRVRRGEGAGFRFIRLRGHLVELLDSLSNDCTLAYEEVRRHMGVDAAHVYGAIVGHLQELCEVRGVPYTRIPVGTVKKHATGKGNADKTAMLLAAATRWGSWPIADDNEADALWIASALREGIA